MRSTGGVGQEDAIGVRGGEMRPGASLVGVILAFAPCVSACAAHARGQASVRANADLAQAAGAEVESSVEAPQPEPSRAAAQAKSNPLPLEASSSNATPRDSYTGILHDLSLKPGSVRRSPCNCMVVSYGRADDSRFDWKADSLRKRDPSAFVIAVSGDAYCDPEFKMPLVPAASIAALAYEGDNIVLTIEAADRGKPLVRGVMAERGMPGGAIVIRPAGRRRGAAGAGNICHIPIEPTATASGLSEK